MACSTKKKLLALGITGAVVTIIGAVMIPIVELVFRHMVKSTVVIKEGGELYEYWLDPPVPIYLQIYMFNLTNKEEFLAGHKPSVVQRGPYTYSEKRVKFDIVWQDNGTVTYRQKRIFKFIRSMSSGPETDMFQVPNPVYWALYNALQFEYPAVREVVYALTQLYDEHPLMIRPVKEILWGYHDPLLKTAGTIDPAWFYTDKIGFFINKNNTDDGVYTVYTGATDINKLGVIDMYNGSSHLKFWTTPWANMVNGSDGTLGPPFLPKTMKLYSFASDACRSVQGEFKKDVETPQGIGLWRFGAPYSQVASVNVTPDNIGYCTPQSHCLGSGLYNATVCNAVDFFNLPVALSFPHFLMADPKYINAVKGMHPDPEQHDIALDLEPITGLVLQAAKRLQINMYMEPVANITETLKIKPVFYPVLWLNESAAIDDVSAKKFFRLLFTPLLIVHVVEGVIIGIGVLILLGTLVYGIWARKKGLIPAPKGEESDSLTGNQ